VVTAQAIILKHVPRIPVQLIHALHALLIHALHALLTHVLHALLTHVLQVHVLLNQSLAVNVGTLAVAKNDSP